MEMPTDWEVKRRIAFNYGKLRGNLSFSEVARRAQTYPTAIKEISEGKRMPSTVMLMRIGFALGVDACSLIEPTEPP